MGSLKFGKSERIRHRPEIVKAGGLERLAVDEGVQDVGKKSLVGSIVDHHSAGCCKEFGTQGGVLCGLSGRSK